MADQQGGKYGSLIRQAKHSKSEDQAASLPDDHLTRQPDEKRVNLCVKVPESLRRHWAIQAKIQDITMTEVMIEALTQRFGLPDDQTTR